MSLVGEGSHKWDSTGYTNLKPVEENLLHIHEIEDTLPVRVLDTGSWTLELY